MTQNIRNLEAINQQMKDEIQALIDSGDTNNILGFHSGPNFVPPRPFLTGGLQDNTRLVPIARCQGKSVLKEIVAIAAENINRAALGICETAKNLGLDSMIIDDAMKEPSFKRTAEEFSAELIENYQKMVDSIEGKEEPIFSQRKFWERQYMQAPTPQSNSAFGFTDVIKIEVEQSAYDKLKEVAIAGHDRIKWHDQWGVEVLAIDCVPVFVNDELTGEGVCRVYTKDKPINLDFYPEYLIPKRPMAIKFPEL